MSVIICTAVFLTCLITASISDIRTKEVSDIVWWIALADIIVYELLSQESLKAWPLFESLLIIFIQQKIMSRYYGRADSHAFSCCALFWAVSGKCLEMHVLHMTVSLVLLTAVQFARHNIGPAWKLKIPIAFIPYISASFTLVQTASNIVK